MITTANRTRPDEKPAWHEDFLDMLPAMRRHAQIAFRELPAEAREEAVAECLANCCVAYARLVELNKSDLAFASVLARYGVAQTKSHRKVGGKLNGRDVLSGYAQRKHGIRVARLDRYNERHEQWKEILVEDKTATPADIAASRIDFGAWLQSLTAKKRKIARTLATGETTSAAARKHRVTPGRISQLRWELKEAWATFHRRDEATAGA